MQGLAGSENFCAARHFLRVGGGGGGVGGGNTAGFGPPLLSPLCGENRATGFLLYILPYILGEFFRVTETWTRKPVLAWYTLARAREKKN